MDAPFSLQNLPSDVVALVFHKLELEWLWKARILCTATRFASHTVLQSHAYLEQLPIPLLLRVNAPSSEAFLSRLRTPDGMAEAAKPLKFGLDGVSEDLIPIRIALQRGVAEAALIEFLRVTPLRQLHHCSEDMRSLLHVAVGSAASGSVVKAILKLLPKGSAEASCLGKRLPLHLALMRNASADTVAALIEAYPGALGRKTADASEGLPLHIACAHGTSPDVVKLLLCSRATCDPLLQVGRLGLPLHAAVEYLTQQFIVGPGQRMSTGYGRSSIRDAAEVVRVLLAAAPQAASMPRRRDMKLPVHLLMKAAMEAGASAVETLKQQILVPSSITVGLRDPSFANQSLPAEDIGGQHARQDERLQNLQRVMCALNAAYPIRPDWEMADLIQSRALGEDFVIAKAHSAWEPTRNEQQAAVMLAIDMGAPERVLRALSNVGARRNSPSAPYHMRVIWRPGVRVRSAPMLGADVVGVRRHGITLVCQSPPDASGWVALKDFGGYVLARPEGSPEDSSKDSDLVFLEVLETNASDDATIGTAVTASVLDADWEHAHTRIQSADSRPWVTPKFGVPPDVLRQGGARMGDGGSYVLPPTRLADAVMECFRTSSTR